MPIVHPEETISKLTPTSRDESYCAPRRRQAPRLSVQSAVEDVEQGLTHGLHWL